MPNPIRLLGAHRHRRFWLTEALLVAGILVFGGVVLLHDARMFRSFDAEQGVTHLVR